MDCCQTCEYEGGCSLCETCENGTHRKSRQGEFEDENEKRDH